jgi:5-methylcytosine-specific restriction endonuclease McrA
VARPAYRTAAYRALKARLEAEDVACLWCGRRASVPDHLIPVALGGTDDDLVPACRPCNAKRGGRLGTSIQRARRRARAELVSPSRPW